MNLHEYQAKEILKKFGVPVPDFWVASTVEEAAKCGLDKAVLKIQVHAGGRGKAGGVKFAKTKEEIKQVAKALIGMKMVNQQTGPEGVIAKKILISAPVDIAKEYYLGAVIDRESGRPILIASPEGGMEIEEIAHQSPEKILKIPFGFDGTLKPYQMLNLAKFIGVGQRGRQSGEGLGEMFHRDRCVDARDQPVS
jgi:succinyl-CoA synthetase beta subunit